MLEDLERVAKCVLDQPAELVCCWRLWARALGISSAAVLTWLVARQYAWEQGFLSGEENPMLVSDADLGDSIGCSAELVRLARLRLVRMGLVTANRVWHFGGHPWRYHLCEDAIGRLVDPVLSLRSR
jgi:hypothetical protein